MARKKKKDKDAELGSWDAEDADEAKEAETVESAEEDCTCKEQIPSSVNGEKCQNCAKLLRKL